MTGVFVVAGISVGLDDFMGVDALAGVGVSVSGSPAMTTAAPLSRDCRWTVDVGCCFAGSVVGGDVAPRGGMAHARNMTKNTIAETMANPSQRSCVVGAICPLERPLVVFRGATADVVVGM